MTSNKWKNAKLKEVIYFNPAETIKKGTLAKKIGMDKLETFQRKISGFEIEEYKSGTKFRNGDTLFARITPCLENGKTAQVTILDDNEIAFGSTEYIVMREILGKSVNDFIYYLSISPEFRDIAIKSMTGTTGRQRAQKDVLENSTFALPPIQEQRAIANILLSLDEKIETNNQINKILEEMAAAIFKHWFVDFEFPNENGEPYRSSGGEMIESELGTIPSGWNVETLGEIINISSGKRPLSRTDNKNGESVIPLVGASSIMGYTSEFNYREPILVIGRVGTHGIVQRFNREVWASDNTLVIKSKYYEYVYQILNMIDYRALNRGSTQPLITQTDIKNSKIILPTAELLISFESLVSKLFTKHESDLLENQKLSIVRNTLLPKLMSGEIIVPIEE